MKFHASFMIPIVLFAGLAHAHVDFSPDPAWTSTDSRCSTGGAVGDIDGDGFMDFIVANGNDMAIEPEVVYFGSASGPETSPGWISGDADYSGHCDLGDVNQDGLPDLVVGNYIDASQGFTPSTTKIYINLGDGFESTPSWVSSDLNNTFSVALGDVDGDGDLDIACANGEAYNQHPQKNDLYLNNDGIFDDLPAWISGDEDASYDVMFADFDQDGDLDLAVANAGTPTKVYMNTGTQLESFASWQADTADSDNSLAWGDIDGDGWLELAVITNDQLNPGTGKIKIFKNNAGSLDTSPFLELDTPVNGMGSAVLWQDFDFDGDRDLAAGSWWGTASVYENTGNSLTESPEWSGNNTFVVEALDYLPSAPMEPVRERFYAGNGSGLFYLEQTPVFAIDTVAVNGVPLAENDYCFDSMTGWLSLGGEIYPGQEIRVTYRPAGAGMLMGTSWGDSGAQGPNYGYQNRSATPTPIPAPDTPTLNIHMNQSVFTGGQPLNAAVEIFNPGDTISADFYMVMDVEGLFFFYPAWTEQLQKTPLNLAHGFTDLSILYFTFPDTIGYSGNVGFYAAIFFPDTFQFIAPLDHVTFEIRDQ